jgi:hypothetical protein
MAVAPSLKVTVSPTGIAPAPGADTVTFAVSVTDCPKLDGLLEEDNAVVVLALFTTCEKAL